MRSHVPIPTLYITPENLYVMKEISVKHTEEVKKYQAIEFKECTDKKEMMYLINNCVKVHILKFKSISINVIFMRFMNDIYDKIDELHIEYDHLDELPIENDRYGRIIESQWLKLKSVKKSTFKNLQKLWLVNVTELEFDIPEIDVTFINNGRMIRHPRSPARENR
jgi:hypothetical protein